MSEPRDPRLTAAWVALIVTLLVPIQWGAHQPFSWDADNIAPGSVLKGLEHGFGGGWSSSYGPVPYVVTAVPYLPALAIMKFTHELGRPTAEYPWGLAHPDASIFVLILLARLVTLVMALGVAWTVARAATRDDDAARGWVVPILALGSAVFVYYARTSNVDMHYLFWLALGFHALETADGEVPRLAGAAACAVAAVCSKEQTAPLAAVILGAAALQAARSPLSPGARLRGLLAIAGAGIAVYVCAWQLPFNAAGWRAHHDFIFHVARYQRAYPLDARGLAALARRVVDLCPVALGWPAIAGAGLALVNGASFRGLGARALGCVLYMAGFIGPIGYVYPRFLLPLMLLALPLAARGWSATFERAALRPGFGALGAASLVLLALSGGPNLDTVMLNDTRYAVQHWLSEHDRPGVLLEIAGNPRFQARPPHGAAVLYTSFDTLITVPRGPRGDIVLLSGIDMLFFRDDPRTRAVWWDSLTAPGGPYRPLVFPPARPLGNVKSLFVSPVVWAYVRNDSVAANPR